jgi:hypothetical protein
MSREALIAAREALIGHGAECKEVNDALALIEKALEQKSYSMRDTLDMAREAGLAPICEGCDVPDVSYAYESWDEELKAFEALVRADERGAKTKTVNLDTATGFTFSDKRGTFIGDVQMLKWLVEHHSKDYWKAKAGEAKLKEKNT